MSRSHIVLLLLALVCVALAAGLWGSAEPPATSAAPDSPTPFALQWGDVTSPHAVAATTVLPGETLTFAAVAQDGSVLPSAVEGDAVRADPEGRWRFTPARGPAVHSFVVTVPGGAQPAAFHVFVAVPHARVRAGRLDDFVVGAYPAAKVVRGTPIEPPRGFIEVTPGNADTPVSPHFTLGQFVCKQPGEYPKYVVLDDRLPLKLERLLARVRAEGIDAATLTVMSGFRTPHYNQGLGNVPYSRHVWGAAADVYLDVAPQDGTMDDLDGDSRIDRRDAEFLAALAESVDAGGIGLYDANAAHGPFVHVDVRNVRARW